MKRRLKNTITVLMVILLSFIGAFVARAESEIDVNTIHERALEIVKYYQDAGYKAAYHNMEPVYVPNYNENGEIEERDGYAVVVGLVVEGKLRATVYLDDKLELKSEGVAVHKYDYDDEGRLNREAYLDCNGLLRDAGSGYAMIKYGYVGKEELQVEYYYDATDSRLEKGSGYLHDYLESLKGKNVTVFIAASDEVSSGMTQAIIDDMYDLGITSSLFSKYRYSAYAVVSPENVFEDSGLQSLEHSGTIGETEYTIKSAGYEAGSYASIVINGVECSKNLRGLNIVVYDNESNSVSDSFTVDTYLRDMPVFR